MKTMKFPSPYDYDDATELFADFLKMNKTGSGSSQRQIANRLNWPLSYISDLIKGRKNLTCLRALEFAEVAQYDPLETEKLVFLGIYKSLPDKQRDKLFSKNLIQRINKKRQYDKEWLDLVYDPHTLAVFETLKWARANLPPKTIKKLLKTYQVEEQEISIILDKLIACGFITLDAGAFKIKQRTLWVDEVGAEAPGIDIHKQFARSFIEFCCRPQGPALYNSVLLELPRKRFDELADRIVALRNWLQELGKESAVTKKTTMDESLVFQLDLNLFPIFDTKVAKELASDLSSDEQSANR